MVALVPIDFRHGILPDRITLPGISAGILFSLVATEPGLVRALLGAAVGAAIPLLIRAVYMLKGLPDSGPHEEERREGMGLGDVKMLAMVGAFLGAPAVLLTILPELLRDFGDFRLVFYGIALTLAVLFVPGGLVQAAQILRARLRQGRQADMAKASR